MKNFVNLFSNTWLNTNPYAFGLGLFLGDLFFGGVAT